MCLKFFKKKLLDLAEILRLKVIFIQFRAILNNKVEAGFALVDVSSSV